MAHALNGSAARAEPAAPRCPRRVVLLAGDEHSDVLEVLASFEGTEVSGARLHAELPRRAASHSGRWVAGEWLGTLGWTRFVWCRR